MSGAIMPAPLAMPLMVTGVLPIAGPGGRDLREGVGGHDRLGGVEPERRRWPRRPGRPSRRRTPWRSSGSPITPVEARNTSLGLQPMALRRDLGGELAGGAAGLAGEGIGVAGIDHQRARLAALELRAAPFDRRRRAFRLGEHAGDRGALSSSASSTSVRFAYLMPAAAVASFTPAIGRHVGHGGRGERGNGSGRGHGDRPDGRRSGDGTVIP